MFSGEFPCTHQGQKLEKIVNGTVSNKITEDLSVQYSFSSKPSGGYNNYFDKMTTYINILCSHAFKIDKKASARSYQPLCCNESEAVFHYVDTASSRSNISDVSEKLSLDNVAIVGLGGTGAYVLDLLAKTPIQAIHLFDGDKYYSHNAFRGPGAASLELLRKAPSKVNVYEAIYSNMHRGIKAHDCFVNEDNVQKLKNMDFVFVCIDAGGAKQTIFEKLEEYGVPFIDVGMGVYYVEEKSALGGIVRVTSSTDKNREHAKGTVSFAPEGDGNNEYETNIQVADLNALNAIQAVIKWKKMLGFYIDYESEISSTYTIDGNHLQNGPSHGKT